MIEYYQNKVECFSKTLCTVNNINQLLKELTDLLLLKRRLKKLFSSGTTR